MDREELLNLYDRIIASEIETIMNLCDRAIQHGYNELVILNPWLSENDLGIMAVIHIVNTFLRRDFSIQFGTTRRRMRRLKKYWLEKCGGKFPFKRYKKRIDVDVNPFRYVSMDELFKNDLLFQNDIEWREIFREYYLKK